VAVTTDTIATALGRDPADGEEAQWTLWIADALLLIEARLGDPAELDQARLDYVVREAVVSHVRNPEDATNVSWSIGDVSTSKQYRSGRGRVTIIDEWWALLSPADDGGAFTIDTVNTTGAHLPWCDYTFGALSCSCGATIAGYPIYELS